MRKGQEEKVRLATALLKCDDAIKDAFGTRFVRVSGGGDTFFHVVIEGENGRRYLEVAVKERI